MQISATSHQSAPCLPRSHTTRPQFVVGGSSSSWQRCCVLGVGAGPATASQALRNHSRIGTCSVASRPDHTFQRMWRNCKEAMSKCKIAWQHAVRKQYVSRALNTLSKRSVLGSSSDFTLWRFPQEVQVAICRDPLLMRLRQRAQPIHGWTDPIFRVGQDRLL